MDDVLVVIYVALSLVNMAALFYMEWIIRHTVKLERVGKIVDQAIVVFYHAQMNRHLIGCWISISISVAVALLQ